ncbi:MAG TPA: hypothetical protein VHZ97_12155 [Pseudonocardiaceae bacterium]|nr:hypothetical protein [Pseudonocardiaceae bacterium]
MNGTSPGRAINPAQPATDQRTSGQSSTDQRGRGEPTPATPVRRVVRLDAEYLSAGVRPKPAQDAIEPEEEQLIVLPRRSGPWIARFLRRIFS